MTDHPFFTVITSSLNMGESLVDTLESIKTQSFHSFEHIVIDAVSTDNTLDLLKRYETIYPLKWVSEPDQGVPDAFNKAIKMSKGKYIIAIQADDYLLNSAVLQKVYNTIIDLDTEYDVISCPIIKGYPGGHDRIIKPIKKIWWHRFRNIFPHQGVFINRKLFNRIGLYNLKYSITEDYDFLYRAISNGCSIHFDSMPVAYMGCGGACSIDKYLLTRLREERELQRRNEDKIFWRIAQTAFWTLYFPYKTRLFTKAGSASFGNRHSTQ